MVLSQLEALTGTPIRQVHVVGGGSRNALLNQWTADACGRPVLAGPVEATVLGNVLLQARVLGELDGLSSLRTVVRESSELVSFVPHSDADGRWVEARERFARLRGE